MVVITILNLMVISAITITLFMDLLAMGSGGLKDRDLGEPIMWMRVGLQALAVMLLLVVVWMQR